MYVLEDHFKPGDSIFGYLNIIKVELAKSLSFTTNVSTCFRQYVLLKC